MHRFKNQLLLAAGFAVVAGVISGVTAAPAIAAAVKAALVKNVDEHGRTPYVEQISCTGGTSISCLGNAPNIPADKRLVIEHVSALISTTNNGELSQVTLISSALPGKNLFFTPTFTRRSLSVDIFTINQPVTYYVEPGAHAGVSMETTSGATVTGFVTITGYLVDLGI